ncbi:S-layer homology domain-containing protein [Heliophilum fasciatum]|uniref:Carboxypeptidase family protein n=1 Tax=Heliophilum fasciatum TaxID=35700 RepID=A0A4R2RM36_9FIRM|nr:S-layer homology domain-containing protein [Heliophilum fasciatum]MCW2279005.1 hypothetical protein [Heliophilum fasciatum]TCP64044.1 carboxypeptidase family protein [Heliophilum fasciatum]
MKIRNRKIISTVLATCMMVGTSVPAFAATITDIAGHWAKPYIEILANDGIVKGEPEGSFRPDRQVTRAEFTTMINGAFGQSMPYAKVSFADVQEDDWFYGPVAVGRALGFVSGYPDNTFRPNAPISRQEAAVIVARTLKLDTQTATSTGFADEADLASWAQGAVGAMVAKKVMNGYPNGTFQPGSPITRAESAVMVSKARQAKAGITPGTTNPPEVKDSVIKGKITLNGQAVADATVNIIVKEQKGIKASAVTDVNGNYSVAVPAGTYDIAVTGNRVVGYADEVEVSKGKQATQDIAVEAAVRIYGVLRDVNNNRLGNTTMAFSTNPIYITTTDKDGNFSIYLLPKEIYTVSVINPNDTAKGWIQLPGVVKVDVGDALIDDIKATFSATASGGTASAGGGGGGGGGGGTSYVIPDVATATSWDGGAPGTPKTADGNVFVTGAGLTVKNLKVTKSLTIDAPNVTLQDVVIEGDLLISDKVADQDAILINVQVKGKIYVRGGGMNSVKLDNVKAVTIVVEKGNVRVFADNGTEVTDAIIVKNSAKIEASSDVGSSIDIELPAGLPSGLQITIVGEVNSVTNNAPNPTLIIGDPTNPSDTTKINNVTSKEPSTVQVQGKAAVTKVVAEAPVSVAVSGDAKVNGVQITGNAGSTTVTATGNAQIENIDVRNGANNTTIAIAPTATVGNLIVDAPITVTGVNSGEQGTVKAASFTSNAGGSQMSKEPTGDWYTEVSVPVGSGSVDNLLPTGQQTYGNLAPVIKSFSLKLVNVQTKETKSISADVITDPTDLTSAKNTVTVDLSKVLAGWNIADGSIELSEPSKIQVTNTGYSGKSTTLNGQTSVINLKDIIKAQVPQADQTNDGLLLFSAWVVSPVEASFDDQATTNNKVRTYKFDAKFPSYITGGQG